MQAFLSCFVFIPSLVASTARESSVLAPLDLRGGRPPPPAISATAAASRHGGTAKAATQRKAKPRRPHKPIEDRVLAVGKKPPGAHHQHGGNATKHRSSPTAPKPVYPPPPHRAGANETLKMTQMVDTQRTAKAAGLAARTQEKEAVMASQNLTAHTGDSAQLDNEAEAEGEHTLSTSGLTEAYIVTMMLVTGSITFIYRGQGIRVVVCILIYLLALSTMKLSVKWVFVVHNYKYPKFITALHLLASMIVGFFILFRRTWLHNAPMVVPSVHEFFCKIVPLALGFAISLGANNIALVFCSAAFAEIIASTTPVVAVGMILVMGMPFETVLLGPTCLVVAGCALSVVGEVNFSLMGLVLCIVSNIMRAFKATMQQQLMTGATKAKFDPCALLAWNCLASFVAMLLWSAATEGSQPWAVLVTQAEPFGLVFSLVVSCVNACILNLSALFVTKDLGAVGAQLVAQTKSVLTVLGGVVVFHETISRQEIYGFAAVMFGTYMYSRTEARLKKERATKDVAA